MYYNTKYYVDSLHKFIIQKIKIKKKLIHRYVQKPYNDMNLKYKQQSKCLRYSWSTNNNNTNMMKFITDIQFQIIKHKYTNKNVDV